MITPDVIVTWPINCDYPLWRQFIRDNRERFRNVVIVLMNTHTSSDYRSFLRAAMAEDNISFLETPLYGASEDWRNVSINAAYDYLKTSSTAEWVWFTEQDFFPREGFWEEVYSIAEEGADYIGIKEGDRLHPACLFIKKQILNRTHKNYSVVPNVSDHFFLIQKDLENMDLFRALCSPDHYTHMAGLSHNMSLLERGEAPNHNVEEFIKYLRMCMKVKVPLPEHFIELYKIYLG